MNLIYLIFGIFNIVLFQPMIQAHNVGETYQSGYLDRNIDDSNKTVFLNYANNIFGLSKNLKVGLQQSSFNNVVFLKGYPVSLPNLNNLKFDVVPENNFHFNVSMGQVGKRQVRSKRGLVHLYNMISCATGCDPIKYKGYGCYCGFLGSGNAVNAIDRCCQMHDKCYSNSGCLVLLEYVVPYLWICYYNKPLCAIRHDTYGESSTCASRLCQCDKYLAECLRRFPCPHNRPLCSTSPISAIQNIFLSIVN